MHAPLTQARPRPPAARAALVKSRDMHWSLLAQRGQRDVSLSSLRLLVVADGANPCEYRLPTPAPAGQPPGLRAEPERVGCPVDTGASPAL